MTRSQHAEVGNHFSNVPRRAGSPYTDFMRRNYDRSTLFLDPSNCLSPANEKSRSFSPRAIVLIEEGEKSR